MENTFVIPREEYFTLIESDNQLKHLIQAENYDWAAGYEKGRTETYEEVINEAVLVFADMYNDAAAIEQFRNTLRREIFGVETFEIGGE